MSVKAKVPEEDPETKAQREAAEARADAGRIDETRDNLSLETRNVLRQFGRAQPGSIAPNASSAGGGSSFFSSLGANQSRGFDTLAYFR